MGSESILRSPTHVEQKNLGEVDRRVKVMSKSICSQQEHKGAERNRVLFLKLITCVLDFISVISHFCIFCLVFNSEGIFEIPFLLEDILLALKEVPSKYLYYIVSFNQYLKNKIL